ncbi:MAG: DUF4351 domain-containing protein [Armatimonadota bacterium]|nr:DUF4351 domain-containing protein [Armatimonadota bacterium]
MSKPYDATTRDLLEFQPIDWLRYAGLEATEVVVINSDLSTITTEADKILKVISPNPWLSHLELQSDYEFDVPDRALRYNVLCCYRHRLPVQSTVVLLRPQADGPNMTGELLYRLPGQEPYLRFEYGVVRVWQKPVEEVLAGGLGTLPLAPLSDVKQDDLPRVVRRMEERITQEATAQEGARLWAATYVLMGLRYSEGLAEQLLEGVRAMEASVTYQAIIRKGRAEEARSLLLRMGSKRFGPPDTIIRTSIESVPTLEQLEDMADRVLDVTSWTDLLKGLS